MKRRDLERQITAAAKAAGKVIEVTHGAKHDKWKVGATMVTIPRHSELGPKLVLAIRRELAAELGKGW